MSESSSSPRSPSPEIPLWRSALGYLGGAFLGAVLLVAAWAKALDPAAFERQISREGLDFLLSAGLVAMVARPSRWGSAVLWCWESAGG